VSADYHAPAYFNAAQSMAASADVWMSGIANGEHLEKTAMRRLAEIVAFARRHCPVYRDLYRGLPPRVETLTDLPVVTKSQLMANLDDALADPQLRGGVVQRFASDECRAGEPLLGRYAVWTSSGTSGDPGYFVHDGQALAVYDALETIRFRHVTPAMLLAQGLAPSDRYAVVCASGGHFLAHSSVQRVRSQYPWLAERVRAFSIMRPVAELTKDLGDFAPTWLATYPTAALLLAGEQSAGRLSLDLHEIRVGGEQLTDTERAHLESVFGCPVKNDYGCSEFPPITWECSRHTMHVNADWVTLEPVDRHMRPVPRGTASHTVLLTNLANRVQPLVRYDLGDSVTIAPDRCACGSRFPTLQVSGRSDDLLKLEGHDGGEVALLPLAVTTVLEEDAGVYRFQLFRSDARSLSLRLAPDSCDDAAAPRARAALERFLDAQGTAPIRIDVELRELAPCGASGKLKRIFCRTAPAASIASIRRTSEFPER